MCCVFVSWLCWFFIEAIETIDAIEIIDAIEAIDAIETIDAIEILDESAGCRAALLATSFPCVCVSSSHAVGRWSDDVGRRGANSLFPKKICNGADDGEEGCAERIGIEIHPVA